MFNFNFVQSDRSSSRKVLSLTGGQAALFSNLVSPYSDIELIEMPLEANVIFDTIATKFQVSRPKTLFTVI